MRVVILGGYGFIGLEIARRLASSGHAVVCVGRSGRIGRRLFPGGKWIEADIAKLNTRESWYAYLDSIDIAINAAGALQSGLKDDVDAIHHRALAALLAACETRDVQKFVQISAVGADLGLFRPWARAASWGMVIVGLGYLVVASVARPDLWADPLEPLLKILPATVLAFVAATMLDSGR